MYDTLATSTIDLETINILAKLCPKKRVGLYYSMGKDCLAAWHELCHLGYQVVPIHFESIRLDFTDQYLKAHEDFFGAKIQRIPFVPDIADLNERAGDTTFRMKCKADWNEWRKKIPVYICKKYEFPLIIEGQKACDSMARRLKFKVTGCLTASQRKFALLWRLSEQGTWNIIKENKIPIPDSYIWYKRSIELSHTIEFYEIRKRYPNDWKKIIKALPNADMLADEFLIEGSKKIKGLEYDPEINYIWTTEKPIFDLT